LEGGFNLYQYAPNPVGWIDPLGLTPCEKQILALREGGNGTVVRVKTKKEADELLKAAFPGAQKVSGIGSQDAKGDRKSRKIEIFDKKGRSDGKTRYHKDYPIDKRTGRVYGHDDPGGNGHGALPHINIKRADGKKVRIDIGGGA
jgi:uncharacterized protein RhaS with RHS repeats